MKGFNNGNLTVYIQQREEKNANLNSSLHSPYIKRKNYL